MVLFLFELSFFFVFVFFPLLRLVFFLSNFRLSPPRSPTLTGRRRVLRYAADRTSSIAALSYTFADGR